MDCTLDRSTNYVWHYKIFRDDRWDRITVLSRRYKEAFEDKFDPFRIRYVELSSYYLKNKRG